MSMDDLKRRLSRDLDSSFPDLVQATQTKLYWGLRRITGDPHHAEDLTQETMIRAYKALQGYDPPRIRNLKVDAWMWTIALNLGRNHLRDRSRRPTLVEAKSEPVSHDPELPDSRLWADRLDHLSSAQRQAVVLRHVVGLGIQEIAEATGRPEGTCKADIHRGLEKLKTLVEAENVS